MPRLLDEHAPHATHAANQFRDIARHEHVDARAHPFEHGGIAHELELIAVSLLADEQQLAPAKRLTRPFGDARHLDPRVFARTPARFVERPALLELAAPQMHQRKIVLRVGVIGVERERVPIMRRLLVEAPLRAERRADAHMNLRVVAQGQRVTVLRFGFGETSAQAQRRAEIHARFEMRRRQFDGALQATDRVIETAEFAQRIAHAKMRAGIRRIERECLAMNGERLFMTLELRERCAEIRARIDETGLMGDGLLVGVDGFVVAAELLQRDAKIVMRVRKRRIDGERAPLACHGERAVGERGRDQPAIAPARGVVRRKHERAVEVFGRASMFPALMQQHAEVMQRLDVSGVVFDDAAVAGFGAGEAPGLVVVEREMERRERVGHGSRSAN